MSNVTALAFGLDHARARLTDVTASHEGADLSAENIEVVRDAVRAIVRAAGPAGITDRELTVRYFAGNNPGCAIDSPRKRRSDLTRDGEVIVTLSRRKVANERVAGSVWVHRDFYKETA